MSVPKDIMMEELNLSSNRGSRMFQERQKRAERFTLENAINGVDNTSNVRNWEATRTRSLLFKVVLVPSRCPHDNYLVETNVRYVASKTTTAERGCQRRHSGAALEGPGFNSSPSRCVVCMIFPCLYVFSRSASLPTGFRNSHAGLTGDCKLPLGVSERSLCVLMFLSFAP